MCVCVGRGVGDNIPFRSNGFEVSLFVHRPVVPGSQNTLHFFSKNKKVCVWRDGEVVKIINLEGQVRSQHLHTFCNSSSGAVT